MIVNGKKVGSDPIVYVRTYIQVRRLYAEAQNATMPHWGDNDAVNSVFVVKKSREFSCRYFTTRATT